ncbi:hypothetical protein [Streptomyces sp. NPDC090036]|uniref:hypothetical protein n=1 Tax=Streptomyces sp. NPDC090036 TaxID=3365926 RepID=UPI0038283A61
MSSFLISAVKRRGPLPSPTTTSEAAGTAVGTAILPWARSQVTTAARSNSGLVSVPPTGAGKPG